MQQIGSGLRIDCCYPKKIYHYIFALLKPLLTEYA